MAHEHNPNLRLQPKGKFPGPLIAIIVAIAIAAAILYYLPRMRANPAPPSGAQVPAQATGQQIQLSHLEVTPDPTGNAARIRGMLTNAGTTTIDAIQLQVAYPGKGGQSAGSDSVHVDAVQRNGQQVPLAQQPVKPGETVPFDINLDHVPPSWNHAMPTITVSQVLANKP